MLSSVYYPVKQRYSSPFLLLLLGTLLTAGLSGCSLYHKVVHPYRLPTPKPSPEFVAQQKADKKAREAREQEARSNRGDSEKATGLGGLFGKKKAPTEAATDISSPSGAPLASATAATPTETRTLPEKSTVRYDKHGLMKNQPKLKRRRIHKTHKPFRPWQAIRHFFKFDLHAKPNYDPDHKVQKKEPVLAPDAPAAPDAPGGPPAAPNDGPPAAPNAGPSAAPSASPAPAAPSGPPASPDAGPKL